MRAMATQKCCLWNLDCEILVAADCLFFCLKSRTSLSLLSLLIGKNVSDFKGHPLFSLSPFKRLLSGERSGLRELRLPKHHFSATCSLQMTENKEPPWRKKSPCYMPYLMRSIVQGFHTSTIAAWWDNTSTKTPLPGIDQSPVSRNVSRGSFNFPKRKIMTPDSGKVRR